MDRKFNIVMFQTGYFCNESKLYEYCIESVKKEFPNDNIMIFHSVEEIENKFHIPHNEYYFYFKLNKDDVALFDYIRLYLTNYLENMIYIDIDIEVFPGFRNYLCNMMDNDPDGDFYRLQPGHSCFCSKHNSERLNGFIDYFTQYCATQKKYFPDTYFGYYMDKIGYRFIYESEDFFVHYNGYGILTGDGSGEKKFPGILCDMPFDYYQYLHILPMIYNKDTYQYAINVVPNDKLKRNYLPHYKDIAGRFSVVSEKFFDYYLQDWRYVYENLIIADFEEDMYIEDFNKAIENIKNTYENSGIFLIKSSDNPLGNQYFYNTNINIIKKGTNLDYLRKHGKNVYTTALKDWVK